MKKAAWALLLVTGLQLCACAQMEWKNGPAQNLPANGPEIWRHEFLFGFVEGQRSFDAARLCPPPSRVSALRTRRNAWQVTWGLLSLGLYTPHSVTVICRNDLS
jgi:hypothetical protein